MGSSSARERIQWAALARRIGQVLLIAWLSLLLHELGHAAVYWLSGDPAWISFQRVHPADESTAQVEVLALSAGPVVTFAAAFVALGWARRRGGFVVPTIAFANATLRIFPSIIALILGVANAGSGFSDEGNIALLLGGSASLRVMIPIVTITLSLVLTVHAVRSYRFVTRSTPRALGLYGLCFSVGFFAFIVDTLLGLAGG